MILNFKTKRTDTGLVIQKTLFGIGFSIDFVTASYGRERIMTIYCDLIFIRFWWNLYKN